MSDNKAALSAFREEVSAWMAENVPSDPGFLLPLTFLEVGTEQQLDFLREWQHKLWSAGYLGMHWPSEYGGQGADPSYQYIVDKELAKHNAPIIFNTIGLNWVGPLLLEMGTDEEKATYIKNILSGEEIWCQGFPSPIMALIWVLCRPAPCATATITWLTAPKSGRRSGITLTT